MKNGMQAQEENNLLITKQITNEQKFHTVSATDGDSRSEGVLCN